MLLEKGANVLSQTYDSSQTALHIAVKNASADCFILLMKFNADVNLQVDNSLYIYIALIFLMTWDWYAQDEEGNTPLHHAIENGSKGILQTMLPMYSTTTFNWGLRNNKGLSVFHLAAVKDDLA